MSVPFIDIHTHHPVKAEDVISVPSFFLQDIGISQTLKMPFTAGIHPWHADKFQPDEIKSSLKNLMHQTGLIAIGETGLDKKCDVDFGMQKIVFEIHMEFAQAFNKPLIIHCVNSWKEIIDYSEKKNISFILHGYNGSIELTKQLITHGFFFSIGKALLNENHKIRESIKIIPVNSLFFETDDEIMDIKEIYNAAASILKCSVLELTQQIFDNYDRIFLNSGNQAAFQPKFL